MIADLKPYPAMKDSGVPWLGAVPGHWEVRRGKWLFRHRKQINTDRSNSNVLSLTLRGVVNNDPDNPEGLVPKDYATYQLFRKGDLVFKLIDLENLRTSRVGLVHEDGIMSSAYVRLVPQKIVDIRFFFQQYFDLYQRGIYNQLRAGVRSTLGPTDLLDLNVGVPPLPEQAAIVRFLDYMDRRIRKYIRAKQKVIKLLEEQRQAIIHSAVTRGLDPNVRLKPSGVEWLADIPKHWQVIPLRRLLSFGPKNGVSPPASNTGSVLTMSISAVRDGCIQVVGNEKYIDIAPHTVEQFRIQSGDILLVRGNGSLDLVAKCGIVTDCRENCIYPDILMKLRPNALILPRFLVYAINSPYVSYQVRGLAKTTSGIFKVSGSSVCSFQMVVPPLLEQEDILDFLEHSLLKISECRGDAQREIALFREYHTRLIADVVTGKLDVRETAARLPDEADGLGLVDEGDTMNAVDDEPVDDLDTVPEEVEA